MKKLIVYFISAFLLLTCNAYSSNIDSAEFVNKYRPVAGKILRAALADENAFGRLSYFCDTFGPRLCGSENLEKSLEWIEAEMKRDGLENVLAEDVMVPHWVRGKEYCELTSPRKAPIPMLGLGGSIATPPEGITAPVLVVTSFEDLAERADEAKGKIVVYHIPFENYGQAVKYRWAGASMAAKYGALASLSRSTSPYCMRNPHTGSMGYEDTIPKIPAAAITEEDAALLFRLQQRGQSPVVKLYMEAKTLPDALSHNVMGEYRGFEKPEEIIALGGHIDSWDIGTGAHDDASGCFSSWEAVKLLKDLGLKPKRTLRAVMWTNEENGMRGGQKYAENHQDEKHVLMLEFDSGAFPPHELRYDGPDSITKILKYALPLFEEIYKPFSFRDHHWGVDIRPMVRLGVPGMSLNTDDKGTYFHYHHSATDTIDKIKEEDYKKCIAALALAIYIYADLPGELPGNNTSAAPHQSGETN